jgi:molecular chaperone DnaK
MPASVSKTFVLSKDGMERIAIEVVEGESTVPGECTPLGTCEVIVPGGLPKGTPVSLTYRYTEDQVLEVLTEIGGQKSHAIIHRAAGFSEEELASATEGFTRITVS